MSRIGKRIIEIPSGTTVAVEAGELVVKGPKGEVRRRLSPKVSVVIEEGNAHVEPATDGPDRAALWGTYASHLNNMVSGASKGFEKKLLIEGVGYRAEVSGNMLTMMLGFSHPVKMQIPDGLKVTSEKGVITITGADKDVVGQFAAVVRAKKPPEPYKGKGIRYDNEVIRRKQGKKTA